MILQKEYVDIVKRPKRTGQRMLLIPINGYIHEEGIPYQTLISSILHKFVTDRLVDEKTIRRSMQLLSSAR